MKNVKRLFWGFAAVFLLAAFAPVAVPTRPSLYSPIGNTVKVDPDAVILKWRASAATRLSTLVDYDIEYSDSSAVNPDGTFVTTIGTPTVAAPTLEYAIPAGDLDYGDSYYWHVRANDSVPSTSAWSATGVFRVGVEPPTVVALAPPPAVDLLTLRPTFRWTPGLQNADSYTIQISMESGFSTIYRTATVLSTAVPANEYIPTTDLTPNILFYWRVRANNSLLGTSDWSVPGSFTTANPPSIPVLVSPKSAKVSTVPVLTWKYVSLPAGETFETYEIEIFNNSDLKVAHLVFTANDTLNNAVAPDPSLGSQTNGSQPTTFYKVPATANLLSATTYYWRVKAYNGDGEYSTSGPYTFYTTIVGKIDSATMDPSETLGNVPGLEDPAIVSPTKTIEGFPAGDVHENVGLLSLRPTFRWDPGALNAQTFTLQVASKASGSCNVADPNNSTFSTRIIDVSLSYSLDKYTANLTSYPNSILCWRIRGNHSLYGSSDWSDVQIFKIANPPGTPVLVAPVNGTLTNDESPKFVWQKVTLPSGVPFGKYEVEISYSSTFTGYDYPDDTVPPYTKDTITYPLDYPILPGNTVQSPIYAVVPPQPLFPKYPIVDQAHNPETDLANTYEQPWYQVEGSAQVVAPFGDPLYGAHSYYWRVRSYNSYGEYSDWSATRLVNITIDRPTTLTFTDCAGAVITDAITPRPCFDWNDVYGAAKYYIQIAKKDSADRYIPILNGASFSSQYQPVTDLPKDIELFWRVSSYAYRYGTSLPTDWENFMSANPPTTPKLLTPLVNQLMLTTTPTFTWSISSFPLGTDFDYYEIDIALDPGFTFLVGPVVQISGPNPIIQLNTSYTIAAALDPATKYYWRVRACNDEVPNECSTWSTTYYFRTAVDAPTLAIPPETVIPPATTLRPIFEWDAVDWATSYTIYVTKNAACVSPIVTGATTSALFFQPKNNLAVGTYYWCVRANSPAYGPGAWSVIDSFLVP